MVIEGRLENDPQSAELRTVGPLGSYYNSKSRHAVLRVTTITHRAGPLLNSFVHGAGAGELASLHQALESLLTPFVRAVVPELETLSFPLIDGWQRCAVLALRGGQNIAARAASAFWGLAWSHRVKLLILVNANVNVHEWPSVLSAVGANADFGSDVTFNSHPEDPTDHGQLAAGSRAMTIDATFKLARKPGVTPARIPEEFQRTFAQRWAELKLDPPRGRTAG
jgi:4-hydroxy-3-polyprenylbenzoate decarboxylase